MSTVSLTDAKANLNALIDRVAGGDTVTITRRGLPVARLMPIPNPPRRPVDLDALQALTAGMPDPGDGAAAFVRTMRDGDRY
ncbi:type II toxin-antitoxin system Phd/YefM family antitoxin [Methylobacterium sp. NEAU 140]|uniref:type II toxin-antitoxin system Phd/YefM family antitoxin n=1 Tax=Methylobacterium sp. NEAU 140 TaxID=3064945 RepID=UPI0027329880|nr:type II toxin-antitoxin system Phd/YefM family antitoxin [Methylobacterium sp. NEAU 140]MDP4022713.1 type II toxin-antitoxin system Phd/YefM family antitoxin [Methylobacterium sp. NEAU 140]